MSEITRLMLVIVRVGVDLAKSVIQVHAVDAAGVRPLVPMTGDEACRFGVWWSRKRKSFTTTRQAAWAAWAEARHEPANARLSGPQRPARRWKMDESSRAVEGPLEPTVVQQWWQPHPLDKWGQMFLLDIASSAAPPDSQASDSPNWCGDVTLPARGGWQVCFFYDCGDLDYIDHFVTPEGEKLDVFADGYQSEQWPPVMNWRGNDDTERFRGLLHNDEVEPPRAAGEQR